MKRRWNSRAEPDTVATMPRISRRKLIKTVIGAGAAATLGGCALPGSSLARRDITRAQPDLIRIENARPGTRDWLLSKTRIDPSTKYRCPWIEGYCSRTSVRAGESISFHISTNPPSPFTLDIYRMGYYAGAGGRHVSSLGPLKGVTQPDPLVGEKRVRDCR